MDPVTVATAELDRTAYYPDAHMLHLRVTGDPAASQLSGADRRPPARRGRQAHRHPIYPGKRYLDCEVDDPAGLPVEQVRVIRDDIDHRVQTLLTELVPA